MWNFLGFWTFFSQYFNISYFIWPDGENAMIQEHWPELKAEGSPPDLNPLNLNLTTLAFFSSPLEPT